MILSDEAKFLIGRCYKNGEVMAIRPLFSEKYTIEEGGKTFKISQELLDEMVSSGRVVVKFQDGTAVTIMGIKGMALS